MSASSSSFISAAGPALTQEMFDKFRALIHEKTGIHMRDGKQILIANRLRKRLAHLELASYEQYYDLLVSPGAGGEMSRFIDAVSTNETYFYRESAHFTALATVILPELLGAFPRVRIWSAGCSTGEEAYTLRLVADQAARAAGVPEPQIVGTDISTTVIARAREGIYRDRALRLVPPDVLARTFVPRGDGSFQVNDQTRARVEFQVHNLFTDPPPWPECHLIFCRNVMIYFDKPTQLRLVDEIFAHALHPSGYLCIGHSESLSGFTGRWTYVSALKAPIYRLRTGATVSGGGAARCRGAAGGVRGAQP